MSGRATFGLLVDWLEDEYQVNVFTGVEDAAKKLGVDLLAVAGGMLRSPRFAGAYRDFAFELVGSHNVSGLVVMAGTISNHVGIEELARYCERYTPLPMCSIGIELEGMPAVLVDNQRGMRNLIVHLIQVHGYRRIAFIRGPEANPEAEQRYRTYRQVLAEYGIVFDAQLVTEGDFQPASAVEAVRVLIDERRVGFDALVAADDSMAMGAIEALQSRGIRVPYDVAVAGFDDVEAARFTSSPLTTVRQPLHEQGLYALQTVLARSRGEHVDERIVLRTQLVVRQSCGCPPRISLPLAQYDRAPSSGTLLETLQSRRHRVIQDMAQALRYLGGSLEPGWGDRLLEALGAELRQDPPGVFHSTLDELLTTVGVLGGNVIAWQGAVSVLRHHAQACFESDPAACATVEEIWHEARVSIGNVAARIQAQQRLRSELWGRILRTTGENLSTAIDPTTLSAALAEELPRLKIPACYVCLFEDDARPAQQVRLAAVHDEEGILGSDVVGHTFPVKELVPNGVLGRQRRTTHAVQPLYFASDQLGYALFEIGAHQGAITEHLRDQLNNVLKSSLLFQEVLDETARRQLAEKERVEQEMNVAAEVQGALAPRVLTAPALRVSAATVPAGEATGDFYQFVAGSVGAWLVVGDVAARGLPVALALLVVQTAISTLCSSPSSGTPSEIVAAVGDVFRESVAGRLRLDLPATLLIARCDRSGRLLYAGCGHEVVICRADTGDCLRLPTTDGLLGGAAARPAPAGTAEVQLEDGDLVVLFSNGSVDARNEHQQRFGVDRLCDELQRSRYQPVSRIRERLLDAVAGFVAVQHEDITILVARFGESQSTLALDAESG